MVVQSNENDQRFYEKVAKELAEIREEIQYINSFLRGIVDVKTAAKILNISIGNLYQKTSKKEIPFYKPNGKLIYFDVQELVEWMKEKDFKRKSKNMNFEEIDNAMLDRLR